MDKKTMDKLAALNEVGKLESFLKGKEMQNNGQDGCAVFGYWISDHFVRHFRSNKKIHDQEALEFQGVSHPNIFPISHYQGLELLIRHDHTLTEAERVIKTIKSGKYWQESRLQLNGKFLWHEVYWHKRSDGVLLVWQADLGLPCKEGFLSDLGNNEEVVVTAYPHGIDDGVNGNYTVLGKSTSFVEYCLLDSIGQGETEPNVFYLVPVGYNPLQCKENT